MVDLALLKCQLLKNQNIIKLQIINLGQSKEEMSHSGFQNQCPNVEMTEMTISFFYNLATNLRNFP